LSSKDEDEDKDLKIGPRGQGLSSRTTTLVIAKFVLKFPNLAKDH